MGVVLMQEDADRKWYVKSFTSAKFSPTEARYHCNEQECLAIVWAIKQNELLDALSRHPNHEEVSPGEPDLALRMPPTIATSYGGPARAVPILSALARSEPSNRQRCLASRLKRRQVAFSSASWFTSTCGLEYHDAALAEHSCTEETIRSI